MRHREQRENEVRTQKLSLGFSRLREQIHVFFSFAVLYSNFVKAGTKVVNEVETYNTRKTFSDSEDEDDSKKQKKKKKKTSKTTKTKKKGKKRKNNETTREPSVVSDEAKQVQKYVSDIRTSLGNSYSRPPPTQIQKAIQKSTKSLGIR